jgi:hypothetical protein
MKPLVLHSPQRLGPGKEAVKQRRGKGLRTCEVVVQQGKATLIWWFASVGEKLTKCAGAQSAAE